MAHRSIKDRRESQRKKKLRGKNGSKGEGRVAHTKLEEIIAKQTSGGYLRRGRDPRR